MLNHTNLIPWYDFLETGESCQHKGFCFFRRIFFSLRAKEIYQNIEKKTSIDFSQFYQINDMARYPALSFQLVSPTSAAPPSSP